MILGRIINKKIVVRRRALKEQSIVATHGQKLSDIEVKAEKNLYKTKYRTWATENLAGVVLVLELYHISATLALRFLMQKSVF